MPYFSVVIPTYNRADLLPRCLDSVLNQTFLDFEVIVVDNFSDDGSVELLRQYVAKDSRVRFIQEHNNGVIAHSRDVGIMAAKGKFIAFLDSDDWYRTDKLEKVKNIIETEAADLIYHPLKVISKKGVVGRLGKRLTWENKYLELLIEGCKLCNSSVVVRKSVLEAIGYISENPEIVAVEDFDCWLRIARAGYSFSYIDDTAGYYWEGDNLSSSDKQVKKIHALYELHLPFVPDGYINKVKVAQDYRKARVYHSIGRFKDARISYLKIFRRADIKVKIKLVLLILLTLNKK